MEVGEHNILLTPQLIPHQEILMPLGKQEDYLTSRPTEYVVSSGRQSDYSSLLATDRGQDYVLTGKDFSVERPPDYGDYILHPGKNQALDCVMGPGRADSLANSKYLGGVLDRNSLLNGLDPVMSRSSSGLLSGDAYSTYLRQADQYAAVDHQHSYSPRTIHRISPPVGQYSPPGHNPLLHSPSKTTPPLLSQFTVRTSRHSPRE